MISSFRTAKALILLLVVSMTTWSPAHAAKWTDLRGTSTIEAELVGIWGEQVILEKTDGTRISVPKMSLRAESRIQAEELNEKLIEYRTNRMAELRRSAAAADAPAPNPLPVPPAPAPYQPVGANLTADAYMHHVNGQSKAGHVLLAVYDGLPPKYRQDADEIFKLATSKIDPDNWQRLTSSLQGLGELIQTRQNWMFTHPRLASMSEGSADTLRQVVLSVAGILQHGLSNDLVSLQKLQSTSLRDFLVEFDTATAPYVATLSQQSSETPSIIVDSTKDDTAMVSVTQGTVTQKVALTNVEGFWVESRMAKEWDQKMTEAKQSLSAMSNGEIMSGGVASIVTSTLTPVIQPMQEAKDETQLHLAMENVFRSVQPLVGALGMFRSMGSQPMNGYDPGYDSMNYDPGYDPSSSYDPNAGGRPGASGPPIGSGPPSGSDQSRGPATNPMESARRAAEAASAARP